MTSPRSSTVAFYNLSISPLCVRNWIYFTPKSCFNSGCCLQLKIYTTEMFVSCVFHYDSFRWLFFLCLCFCILSTWIFYVSWFCVLPFHKSAVCVIIHWNICWNLHCCQEHTQNVPLSSSCPSPGSLSVSFSVLILYFCIFVYLISKPLVRLALPWEQAPFTFYDVHSAFICSFFHFYIIFKKFCSRTDS